MEYVAGNIAREVGRLHDWREKLWSRRYRSIVVSDEEEAKWRASPTSSAMASRRGSSSARNTGPASSVLRLCSRGPSFEGTWFDRAAEYEARRRGEAMADDDFATSERVVFTPLPCWATLDAGVYRGRIAAIIRRIVEEGRHERAGRPVLGKRAILSQDPHDRPLHSDHSPAPAVHAASKEIRVMLCSMAAAKSSD